MLTAINTETGVVRWVVKMPHPVASLELNKRHQSLVDALQPPYAVVHYRGIKAQEPPELAPWLQQARVVGIGGQVMTRHDFALLPAAGAAAAPARRAVTERLPGPVRRTPQPLLGADPGRECAGSASDCALLCVGVPVSLQLLCCCVGVWVCVCCACVRRAACVYVCCVVLLLRWLVCMPVSLCWCACVGSPSCALHPT